MLKTQTKNNIFDFYWDCQHNFFKNKITQDLKKALRLCELEIYTENKEICGIIIYQIHGKIAVVIEAAFKTNNKFALVRSLLKIRKKFNVDRLCFSAFKTNELNINSFLRVGAKIIRQDEDKVVFDYYLNRIKRG